MRSSTIRAYIRRELQRNEHKFIKTVSIADFVDKQLDENQYGEGPVGNIVLLKISWATIDWIGLRAYYMDHDTSRLIVKQRFVSEVVVSIFPRCHENLLTEVYFILNELAVWSSKLNYTE